MTVEHGVDLEAFEEFVEFAAENPDEVQLELSARGIAEDRALHSLARVREYSLGGERIDRETREYTFPLGAWREVEDAAGFVSPTDRPEPVEVTLAALTGCLNVAVGITALHEGIDLEGLETTVRVDFDPRIVLYAEDVERADRMFEDIDVEIEVGGDVSEAERERLEAGARRSPVWTLMSMAHDMEPRVSRADVAAASTDD